MAKLVWDKLEERVYETGIDHGILYRLDEEGGYTKPYVWNGITSVSESPEGGEPNEQWADNTKYLELMSSEQYKCTLEAFTYPDAFAECDGSVEPAPGMSFGQQTRERFGLCYRTKVGNANNADAGYKIHLIYGCLASPSGKDYQTVNDSPEAITFSWEISTTPVDVTIGNTTYKPTAHVIVDTTKISDETKITALLNKLYGTDAVGETQGTTGCLPLPAEVYDILKVTG